MSHQLQQQQQKLIYALNKNKSEKETNVFSIDKEGPSSDSWFHGNLDRVECEERLRNSAKCPCFLLRFSQSRSGSFTLSYLSLDGNINHYRITPVFGDYYIGGRGFDSLETLVSYYMFYSFIKQNENLVNPIAPLKPCKVTRDCIALKTYLKFPDSDQLSFGKGDYLKVYHVIGDSEWVWTQLLHTKQFGMVNNDCIIDICDIDPSKLHEYESWYYDDITREDASIILANLGHCSYLVRPSETSHGSFTLFFNTNGFMHCYRITKTHENNFQFAGIPFKCISDIIEYYKCEDIIAGYKLTDKHHTHVSLDDVDIEAAKIAAGAEILDVLKEKSVNETGKFITVDVKSLVTVVDDKTITQSNRISIGPDIINRNSDQLIKGYLEKYVDKTKKWKSYYFVLNQTERQLFYFANEKKINEKGLIDLCYSLFYPVDDSLFNKKFCFQIVTNALGNGFTTHYLSTENQSLLKEWSSKIRLLCDPIQINQRIHVKSQILSSNPSISSSLSTVSSNKQQKSYYIDRSLYIEIKEAKNLINLLINQNMPQTSNTTINLTTLQSNEPIHKQNSSPLPQSVNNHQNTILNNTQQSKCDLVNLKEYNYYYYYCVLILNNDIYVASTNLLTINNKLNKNDSQQTQQFIWDNEKFTFDSLPLDIYNIKVLLYATKRSSITNTFYVHGLNGGIGKSLSSSLSTTSFKNTLFHNSSPSTTSKSAAIDTLTNGGRLYKSKSKESTLIGEVNVPLADLLNKGLCDEWYKIDNINNQQIQTTASIRIKLRFNENKILLNLLEYKNLIKYLLKSSRQLCIIYDYYFSVNNFIEQRNEYVDSLFKLYDLLNIKNSDLMINMLKSYIENDIKKSLNLNTLFRSTTLATSLMDLYMKNKCDVYLVKAIYEPLQKIIKQTNKNQKSFELDPNKIKQNLKLTNSLLSLNTSIDQALIQTNLEQNLLNFKQAFNQLLESICLNSMQNFPFDLKLLFSFIRKRVCLKYPNDRYVRVNCVSAFIFLRLICPTLINTTTTTNLINTINERNIKLLTKVLQTLANLNECKEDYLIILNDYLNNNRSLIIQFIDNISSVSNGLDSDLTADDLIIDNLDFNFSHNSNELNLCKTLATTHRVLSSIILNTKVDSTIEHNLADFSELIDILNEINKKIIF